jgi:hypothetical protein
MGLAIIRAKDRDRLILITFVLIMYSERDYVQIVIHGIDKVDRPRLGCVENWKRRVK